MKKKNTFLPSAIRTHLEVPKHKKKTIMEQYFAETLQVSIGSWHDVIYPKLATMLRKRFRFNTF